MNKVIKFCVVCVLVFSTTSQAQQPLTKELITSFQAVANQWQTLEGDYPELTASLDDLDFSKASEIIAKIKTSKAYPKISSMLSQANFDDIEQYYDVAMRLMGGLMAYQMDNLSQGMSIDAMGDMLSNSLAQMKAANAPQSMITEMEKQLVDVQKSIKMMQSAMKNLSAADKKFISDNAQWIMTVLDDDKTP